MKKLVMLLLEGKDTINNRVKLVNLRLSTLIKQNSVSISVLNEYLSSITLSESDWHDIVDSNYEADIAIASSEHIQKVIKAAESMKYIENEDYFILRESNNIIGLSFKPMEPEEAIKLGNRVNQ